MDTLIKTYERQEGESEKHYSWFYEYMMLGPGRSLAAAYRSYQTKLDEKVGKSRKKSVHLLEVSGAWREAAENFNWSARASEWDGEQRRIAADIERAKWEERAERIRDMFYDESMLQLTTAQKARTKADEVLLLPVVKKKTSADGSIVIHPLEDVTLGDASRLLNASSSATKTANELARIACNIHVSKIALEIENLDADEIIEQSIATLETLGYTVIAPTGVDATPET